MNLLSWIAKKTGLIVVHVTVVRESHGRIRVIQSTFPHFEYSWINHFEEPDTPAEPASEVDKERL
ncbi:hypothetical protein MAP00_006239 [Monascus purpureus]|nr:hypothetical protein MAP00_006239 [Monascus purpureus]